MVGVLDDRFREILEAHWPHPYVCKVSKLFVWEKKIHIAAGWKLVEIVEVALNTTANFTPLSVNDVKVKLS